jgi:hypothetical protein
MQRANQSAASGLTQTQLFLLLLPALVNTVA